MGPMVNLSFMPSSLHVWITESGLPSEGTICPCPNTHISLRKPPWLSVAPHIQFKTLLTSLKPCKPQYLTNLIHPVAPARLLRSYGSNLLIFSKFILSSVSGRAFGGTLSVKYHLSLHPNPSCWHTVFMSSASFCCIHYLPSFIFVC